MRTLDQIRLKPNERAAIEAAAAILREKLPVAQIILFGSKARGDDREDSDIDLLLLATRRLSWEERKQVVHLLYPLELQYEVIFGTLEVSEDDWFQGIYQVLPLRTEVERDGVAA
ncbi:MAG: nucleotidyltransferase domain-containing protein [Planctomycetota bacterium]